MNMYLSRIWSKSKGPALSLLASIFPLIGGIWSFDFQKLSPDTTLSSQAVYSTRVELTIWFLLIVSFLLSCVFIYSLAIITRDKKASKEELAETVRSIREAVENRYTIYQRETLSPSIDKAMHEEARKGFSFPQGSLANRLFDIYLKEVSVYSSMIREFSLSITSNSNTCFSSPEFIRLFNELLISHNKKIKNYHNRQVTEIFTHGSSTHAETMVEQFNNQADIETKLRCKELLSSLKIKNLSTCAEMAFQSWEPIIKEKPKPHIFVEEDAK